MNDSIRSCFLLRQQQQQHRGAEHEDRNHQNESSSFHTLFLPKRTLTVNERVLPV
ncbi:MAG: hypothetical protein GY789_18520 [Hyphomicrobiales bacterium]|nr:hypothetical protein [Hyphomicrobiales bacterium]MCP5000246.1 hypothetical protein [Hyphomicrobiales bacterium]